MLLGAQEILFQWYFLIYQYFILPKCWGHPLPCLLISTFVSWRFQKLELSKLSWMLTHLIQILLQCQVILLLTLKQANFIIFIFSVLKIYFYLFWWLLCAYNKSWSHSPSHTPLDLPYQTPFNLLQVPSQNHVFGFWSMKHY